MGYLNKTLSCYRQHDTNIIKDKVRFLGDSIMLHTNNYDRIVARLTDDNIRAYRHKIARYCHELAYLKLLSGQTKEARTSYRDAVRWAFTQPFIGSYLKSLLPSAVWYVARQAAQHISTRKQKD
jgi:hypothetical protein